MIFGTKADTKLKYAKAKAKQTEFMVDESRRTSYPLESDDLHYSAILALSSYARARLSGSPFEDYLRELEKVASFYNAAANDGDASAFGDGYWQLAMVSYFLLGNFGSARVAAGHVGDPGYYGRVSSVITQLIKYLFQEYRSVWIESAHPAT